MDSFTITLTEQNQILTVEPRKLALGSQYDNEVQRLVFVRPAGRESDELIVYFSSLYVSIDPINIGMENQLVLTERITKFQKLDMQVAFLQNNTALKHSDKMEIVLRPSIKSGLQAIQTGTDAIGQIQKKAFTGAEVSDGVLSFMNVKGVEVASVTLPTPVGGVPEAPADGKTYGRKDENWAEVTGGVFEITTTTPVTGVPNGKLLGVQDGKVAAVDASQGGSVTPDTATAGLIWGTHLTTDKNNTIGEISGSGTIYDRRIMLFGDSITAGALWRTPFAPLILAKNIDNLAIGGATWRDGANAVLDGNPVVNGASNMIANQVQKVINNIDDYQVPEIVIFYAGVNDSYGAAHSAENINQYYVNDGASIPLSSLDRKNLASAIRWSVETVRNLYPYAHILLVTPYQVAIGKATYNILKSTRDVIMESALRLGAPCIDLFNTSGIYSGFEANGAAGRYLSDGLHPNTEGGRVIANRIFDAVRGLSFPYREITPKYNMIKNADFSNGTTNWITGVTSTITAAGGVLTQTVGPTFSATSFSSRQEGIAYIPGHKYYLRIMMKSDLLNSDQFSARWFSATAANTSIGWFTTKTDDWTMLSAVATAVEGWNRMNMVTQFKASTTTPRGQTMQYKEPMVIDLTALYGAGNEPTVEYLNGQIRFFTESMEV